MKTSLLLSIIILNLTTYAQIKVTELTHYILPEFTKGFVFMKSGIKIDASLNYNSLTEEMIFENKESKRALSDLAAIDSILIGSRRFIIHENKILELIYQSKLSLLASHKCTVKDPGKPTAYGGTSQTSSISSYSSYIAGGQVYELKLPDGYETRPFCDYWIITDSIPIKFLTTKQLTKLFPNKENEIKEYIKNNNVKIDDQESILGLIKYIESIY